MSQRGIRTQGIRDYSYLRPLEPPELRLKTPPSSTCPSASPCLFVVGCFGRKKTRAKTLSANFRRSGFFCFRFGKFLLLEPLLVNHASLNISIFVPPEDLGVLRRDPQRGLVSEAVCTYSCWMYRLWVCLPATELVALLAAERSLRTGTNNHGASRGLNL